MVAGLPTRATAWASLRGRTFRASDSVRRAPLAACITPAGSTGGCNIVDDRLIRAAEVLAWTGGWRLSRSRSCGDRYQAGDRGGDRPQVGPRCRGDQRARPRLWRGSATASPAGGRVTSTRAGGSSLRSARQALAASPPPSSGHLNQTGSPADHTPRAGRYSRCADTVPSELVSVHPGHGGVSVWQAAEPPAHSADTPDQSYRGSSALESRHSRPGPHPAPSNGMRPRPSR